MLKQYITHILTLLFIILAIIQDGMAVNYTILSDEALMQLQSDNTRQIDILKTKITNSITRNERASIALDITDQILAKKKALERTQELGNANLASKIKDDIAQLKAQLEELELIDDTSIEHNKNLNIRIQEGHLIKYELDNRRNNNQQDSLLSAGEHNNNQVDTENSLNDVSATLDNPAHYLQLRSSTPYQEIGLLGNGNNSRSYEDLDSSIELSMKDSDTNINHKRQVEETLSDKCSPEISCEQECCSHTHDQYNNYSTDASIPQHIIEEENLRNELKLAMGNNSRSYEDLDSSIELSTKDSDANINHKRQVEETLNDKPSTVIEISSEQESDQIELNNKMCHLHQKIEVQAHKFKTCIDTTRAKLIILHTIIKNRLPNTMLPLLVAAGGDDKQDNTGIWSSAGYSIAKQGNISNHLPYKSRMVVMTIGGDIALGDSNILGIAYSNAKANLKFNSLKGKSRINSHILSIYSQHDLQRNFYLQLVGSAASNTIKSKIEGENKKKSYVDNISLESNLTYRHSFSNGMQLLPTIGMTYNYFRGGVDKGQKQAKQTIIVNHKHERILSSAFGTKVIFNSIEFGSSLQLTTTIHTGLERRMTGGRKIIMASINTGEGAKGDVRVEMPRVVKNKYNLGVGLIAQSRNVKLQLDYNYSLQKSYKVHEGALKLTVSL